METRGGEDDVPSTLSYLEGAVGVALEWITYRLEPSDMGPSAPFNTLGETVEWWLRDGRPFAVIVRYELVGPAGTGVPRSDLAVIAVGRDGAPGCLVGYVSTDAAPIQNAGARAPADARDVDFASVGVRLDA